MTGPSATILSQAKRPAGVPRPWLSSKRNSASRGGSAACTSPTVSKSINAHRQRMTYSSTNSARAQLARFFKAFYDFLNVRSGGAPVDKAQTKGHASLDPGGGEKQPAGGAGMRTNREVQRVQVGCSVPRRY